MNYICDTIQFYGAFWYAEYMNLELDSKTNEFVLSYFKVQDGWGVSYIQSTGTYIDKSDIIILSHMKKNIVSDQVDNIEDDIYVKMKNFDESDYKEAKDLLLETADEFDNYTSEFTDNTDISLFYKIDENSLRIPKEYNYKFDRIFNQ